MLGPLFVFPGVSSPCFAAVGSVDTTCPKYLLIFWQTVCVASVRLDAISLQRDQCMSCESKGADCTVWDYTTGLYGQNIQSLWIECY